MPASDKITKLISQLHFEGEKVVKEVKQKAKEKTEQVEKSAEQAAKIVKDKANDVKKNASNVVQQGKDEVKKINPINPDRIKAINELFGGVTKGLRKTALESNLKLQQKKEDIKNNESGIPQDEKNPDLLKKEQKVLDSKEVPVLNIEGQIPPPPPLPPTLTQTPPAPPTAPPLPPDKANEALKKANETLKKETEEFEEGMKTTVENVKKIATKTLSAVEENDKSVKVYESALEKSVKEYKENKVILSGKDEQERELIERLNEIYNYYLKNGWVDDAVTVSSFSKSFKECLESNVLKRKKTLGSRLKRSYSNVIAKDIIKLLEYAQKIYKSKSIKSYKKSFDKTYDSIIKSLNGLKNKKNDKHMPLFAKEKINKALVYILNDFKEAISKYCKSRL